MRSEMMRAVWACFSSACAYVRRAVEEPGRSAMIACYDSAALFLVYLVYIAKCISVNVASMI